MINIHLDIKNNIKNFIVLLIEKWKIKIYQKDVKIKNDKDFENRYII